MDAVSPVTLLKLFWVSIKNEDFIPQQVCLHVKLTLTGFAQLDQTYKNTEDLNMSMAVKSYIKSCTRFVHNL